MTESEVRQIIRKEKGESGDGCIFTLLFFAIVIAVVYFIILPAARDYDDLKKRVAALEEAASGK